MKTPHKIAAKYPLLVQMARAAFGLLPGCGVINFGIFAVQAGQRLWGWMQARTPQERVLVLQDATQAATGDMQAAIAEAKKQLAVELKDVSPEAIANVTNWLQSAPGHLNRTFGGTFEAMQVHGGSQLAALNSANRLHMLYPGRLPVMQPGQPIERSQYECKSLLGSGGFGEVWLAKHSELSMEAAFKFCTDEKALRTLQNEKDTLNLLQNHVGKHPNIVPLLGCCLDTAVPWLHFEYVKGLTLAQWVAAHGGPVPEAEVIQVLRQIGEGLTAAHKVGVVHSDMKPANVIMDEQHKGRARILDFGIGRVSLELTREYTRTIADQDWLSSAGTLNYMSREQREGHPASPSDDVYAVGVMAYQMLVGDLHTDTSGNVNTQLERNNVTGELKTVVGRCLEDRVHRYKDASELLEDLPSLNLPKKLKWGAATFFLSMILVGAIFLLGPMLFKQADGVATPTNETIATGGQTASNIASDEVAARQEAAKSTIAPSNAVHPDCPHASAFDGEWYFTRQDVGGHERFYLNQSHHVYYELSIKESDCSVQATVKNMGRTYNDATTMYSPANRKSGQFKLIAEPKPGYGGAATGHVILKDFEDKSQSIEFHFIADKNELYGWWTYMGSSWQKDGRWGVLKGSRRSGDESRNGAAWEDTRIPVTFPGQPCSVKCRMGCGAPRLEREFEEESQVFQEYLACKSGCASAPRKASEKCRGHERHPGLAKEDRKHSHTGILKKDAKWWRKRCEEHYANRRISYAFAACWQVFHRDRIAPEPGAEDSKLHYTMYRLYKRREYRHRQLEHLAEAVKENPKNDEAKTALESFDAQPGFEKSRHHYAMHFLEKRRKNKIKLLRLAVQEDPKNSKAKEALKQLDPKAPEVSNE